MGFVSQRHNIDLGQFKWINLLENSGYKCLHGIDCGQPLPRADCWSMPVTPRNHTQDQRWRPSEILSMPTAGAGCNFYLWLVHSHRHVYLFFYIIDIYIYMFTVHISSCIYRMYTHTHAFPRLFLLIGCFMIVRPHGTCHEGRPLIPKWVFQAVLSSFICPWIPWFFLAPLVGNSMS